MKNPTFLGVRPWFLITRSWDKFATMDCAEHPGFAVTNRIISFFNRSNRAFFWEPFPNRLGDIITTFVVYGYERNGGFPYSNETG